MTDTFALNRVFQRLEAAAVKGERCPQSHELSRLVKGGGGAIGRLARAGRIRSEVSGRNWRTVTILEGPHRGKKTAPDPSGSPPYYRMDASGGRYTENCSRNQPRHTAEEKEAKRLWVP